MPRLLRASPDPHAPLVPPAGAVTPRIYFNLLNLRAGETHSFSVPGFELLCVVLSGQVEITVGAQTFPAVGRRADIWGGQADSVYCGTGATVTVRAPDAVAEVAVAGGACAARWAPFRITPAEVEMVEVGSVETHSRRRIYHVLGQNGAGRAGNLLVSELYGDPGCWSGYPPHRHDTERPPEETAFEELYHYRYRPETGFGVQLRYDADGGGPAPEAELTRHGDTYLIDRGYHPTVRAPGFEGYIFTILVGHHQRSLIQYFEPVHMPQLRQIPGLQAMRDKFK